MAQSSFFFFFWNETPETAFPYLGTASLLWRCGSSLSFSQRNFMPERVTASLIQRSSSTEDGLARDTSSGVLAKASST